MHTDQYHICSYHTDFRNRLTPGWLFRFAQESARLHAAEMDLGYDTLKHSGLAWILSRMYFEINAWPALDADISLKTWPSSVEGLFAIRDFEILDAVGNSIARSRSSWLVINVQSRRPQKLESLKSDRHYHFDEPVIPRLPEKICHESAELMQELVWASYNDIDIYQHVNNTRYIDWIMNDFTLDFHKQHELVWLEINFLAELAAGEKIDLFKSTIDEGYSHAGKRADGREAFRAVTRWKSCI